MRAGPRAPRPPPAASCARPHHRPGRRWVQRRRCVRGGPRGCASRSVYCGEPARRRRPRVRRPLPSATPSASGAGVRPGRVSGKIIHARALRRCVASAIVSETTSGRCATVRGSTAASSRTSDTGGTPLGCGPHAGTRSKCPEPPQAKRSSSGSPRTQRHPFAVVGRVTPGARGRYASSRVRSGGQRAAAA